MFWIFSAVLVLVISFLAWRYSPVRNAIGNIFQTACSAIWRLIRRLWAGWLQPALIIGLVAAVLLFGLTVAAMSFGNPMLTATILVAWVAIYMVVVGALTSSTRTANLGLQIRSGLGSLLMLLIVMAIINQMMIAWYGGGIFAGNAGERAIIILAITGIFFSGFLLKVPPQSFWKLCRVVIIGIVVLYFVGWGVVNVSPVKSHLTSMRADLQIQTTKRDINTAQKSLFGRLLNREKGQVAGQDQIMVFMDLPEGTFTLPVYDEKNRVIGFAQHGEVVNVFLGRFADFEALQANFQSLQTVNVQSLNGPGGGIALEGYLRFRDSLSAAGVPTFFFSLTAPNARQGPKVLKVTEEGSVYLWDSMVQLFVKGADVLPKGTKVRMLPGSRWSPSTNDEFVQVLVGSGPNGDEFEGQTPVWFLRRKILPANPGGGGLGGQPGTRSAGQVFRLIPQKPDGNGWYLPDTSKPAVQVTAGIPKNIGQFPAGGGELTFQCLEAVGHSFQTQLMLAPVTVNRAGIIRVKSAVGGPALVTIQ